MFWVNDTIEARHAKIRGFAARDVAVAGYILAAADFEWTIRRAILALGHRATGAIREETLKRCTGDEQYKDAWKREVYPKKGKRLPEVIPNWHELVTKAFPLRHRLVHGVSGAPGLNYVKERREVYLLASRALVDYAASEGANLYARLPVRRKDR
jgi:hypothetical protein